MSQELADLQPVEQTQATVTDAGTVEKAAPEVREQQPEKPKTLREEIVSATKEVSEEIKKRGNPYKSADGKFTKKPLETKAPETAATEVTESTTKPDLTQQPQVVAMPKAWSADKQQLWDQLPQAVKDFLVTREDQVSKGFAEYGEKERRFKDIDTVLAPYQPMLQAAGRSAPEAIHQALSWHAALSNEQTRGEAFRTLLQAYPYQLGSPAADSAQQPHIVNDPRVDQVLPVIEQMRREQAEATRREQEAQMRQTSEKVGAWAKDKPHYEKVRVDMGLRIKAAAEAGREMNLDEAYEASIWAHPEIREGLMKERFESEQKAAREKAEKAKLASVSVTTRSPAPVSNGQDGKSSLRNTIKDAMATVNGAGRA